MSGMFVDVLIMSWLALKSTSFLIGRQSVAVPLLLAHHPDIKEMANISEAFAQPLNSGWGGNFIFTRKSPKNVFVAERLS